MDSEFIYALAFYATAAVTVASAFMVIWHRNPVVSAVYLVLCFFAVAVNYVLLQAHFLAAIQVLVYAGAILVLFLMIVMLVHQDPNEVNKAKPTLGKALGVACVFGTVLIMVTIVAQFKAIHVSGHALPRELVAFLIELGDDPGDYSVKVKLVPGGLSQDDLVLVAEDALEVIDNDREAMSRLELPGNLSEYPDHRIENIRKSLLAQMKAGAKLKDIKINKMMLFADEKDLSDELAIEFMKAVARGRLKQLEEFGTTAAVGRHLFKNYMLPFEASSILLLAAILGVLVLSRRLPGEERQ